MKRFIRHLATLALLAWVAAMSSCIMDEHIIGGEPGPKSENVTLQIKVPAPSPSTRALANTDEYAVSEVSVMAFDATDEDLAYMGCFFGKITSGPTGNGVPGDASATMTFEVSLPKGEFDLMVVTNANAIVEASDAEIGDPQTEVEQAVKMTMATTGWITDKTAAGYVKMPMWGYIKGVEVPNESIPAATLNLTRMLAKVNVSLGTTLIAADKFELRSVRVYNYMEQGRLVPETDPTKNGGFDWTEVTQDNLDENDTPSLPTGYTKATAPALGAAANSGEYIERTLAADATSLTGEIYLFEAPIGVAPAVGDDDFVGNTCLVIGGVYDNDGDGFGDDPITYYRIDFATRSVVNNQVRYTYMPILRNNSYSVSITDITADGHVDQPTALNNIPVNITANVLNWANRDMETVLTDGIYYLAVSQGEFLLDNMPHNMPGDYNQLTIETNVPTGWTTTLWANEACTTPIGAPWGFPQPAAVPTPDPDGDDVFIQTGMNPPGAGPRTFYIRIEAGTLRYVVKVTQEDYALLQANIVDPTSPYIIYYDEDTETLQAGSWSANQVTQANIMLFKFGGVVGVSQGAVGGQAFAAADVKFAPTETRPTTWAGIGRYSDFPVNVSSDQYHNAANIALGKGDPCRLIGLTEAQIKAGITDNKQYRLPTAIENIGLVGGQHASAIDWAPGDASFLFTPENPGNNVTTMNYWQSVNVNGVPGGYFPASADGTLNTSGIFLPAAGYRNSSGLVSNLNVGEYYWSSLAQSETTGNSLAFTVTDAQPVASFSYGNGFSIRCIRIVEAEYDLSVTVDGGGGTVTPTVQRGTAGRTVTFSATPDADHVFAGWYSTDGSVLVPPAAKRIQKIDLVMPARDVRIEARFAPKAGEEPYIVYYDPNTRTLQAGSWANGTVAQDNAMMFKFGSVVGVRTEANGATYGTDDVLFNPMATPATVTNDWATIPLYSNDDWNAVPGITNISDSRYHNTSNIARGKGDPCKLIGLTPEQIRAGAFDSGRFRMPTSAENDADYGAMQSAAITVADYPYAQPNNGQWLGDAASFLPTAGDRGGPMGDFGSLGHYWSSTAVTPEQADFIRFNTAADRDASRAFIWHTIAVTVRCVSNEMMAVRASVDDTDLGSTTGWAAELGLTATATPNTPSVARGTNVTLTATPGTAVFSHWRRIEGPELTYAQATSNPLTLAANQPLHYEAVFYTNAGGQANGSVVVKLSQGYVAWAVGNLTGLLPNNGADQDLNSYDANGTTLNGDNDGVDDRVPVPATGVDPVYSAAAIAAQYPAYTNIQRYGYRMHSTGASSGMLFQWGYDVAIPTANTGIAPATVAVYDVPARDEYWSDFYDDGRPRKTLADPCPYGWRVPTAQEGMDLVNGTVGDENKGAANGTYTTVTWSAATGLSVTPKVGDTDRTLVIPNSGYRFSGGAGDALSGEARFYGENGFYKVSTPVSNSNAFYVSTGSGVPNGQMLSRTKLYAHPVRCVRAIETGDTKVSPPLAQNNPPAAVVPVAGVALDVGALAMVVGGGVQRLVATVSPAAATYPVVDWRSSNPAVASVALGGVVTPHAAGAATITAMSGGRFSAACNITVTPPAVAVSGVTLNTGAFALIGVGTTRALTATVAPANATDRSVTWSSSAPAVASVSASGVVTAVGTGNAVITVRTNDGSKTATCAVTVTQPVASVTLNAGDFGLTTGMAVQLEATVAPANASNKAVTWSSSNSAIASVSASGVVTAVAPGAATITVRTTAGAKTATCAITVTQSVTGVSLNRLSLTNFVPGETFQLVATVAPANASNKAVTWSSSNAAIASVSASGIVTAVAPGAATITVRTTAGAKTATCTITVTQPVTSVSLNRLSLTNFVPGETFQLVATVAPANASNKAVQWAVQNAAVATVSNTGLVTARAAGQTQIAVGTLDGNFIATCTVTVTAVGQTLSGGVLTIRGTGAAPNLGVDASITSIVMQEGITSIPDFAFNDLSNLQSVSIPASVTSIGGQAFQNLARLTNVTFAAGSRLTSLGIWAFKGCSALTGITLPAGLTSIGDNTFYLCTNLRSITIPNAVTSIGSSAFQNCTSLASVNLGTGVKTIGGQAFLGCTALTSLSIPNSVTTIDPLAFQDCTRLATLVLGTGLTSLGNQVFNKCSLTSITSYDTSPATLGNLVFYGATKTIRVPAAALNTYRANASWAGYFTTFTGF